ncbi:MAG: slipin family protein [Promethearchaeati archaeon SRVP18_Atabeyarchaeia-1]
MADFLFGLDITFWLLIFFITVILVGFLAASIRLVKEYERAVIFRLGRLVGAKGPGLFFRLPWLDKFIVVDLRVITSNVPKQRVITRDNVTVDVDAVVYYRVLDPSKAIVRVMDYADATNLLAQTTLRDTLGQVELDELLAKRDELNKKIQGIIDQATETWGIKVTAVLIRDVTIPPEMQRAIAKQAEAEREKRARIIVAEGELQASKTLYEAAKKFQDNPIAMRIRELQTLTDIAREKNMVIVTPAQIGTNLGEVIGAATAVSRKSKRTEEEEPKQ